MAEWLNAHRENTTLESTRKREIFFFSLIYRIKERYYSPFKDSRGHLGAFWKKKKDSKEPYLLYISGDK